MPQIPKIYPLEIKSNYYCNDQCIFCSFYDKKNMLMMDTKSIKENICFFIDNYKIDEIVLSGGEPTIRKDFSEILSYSKSMGIKTIYLHTNAIKFSDSQFLRKTVGHISKALVGFHAHDRKLYNKISDSDNFDDKVAGIANLLYNSIPIRTNTVIVNDNVMHLPNIADFLVNIGVKQSLLTFPFPIGRVKDNFTTVIPRDFKIMNRYLREAVEIYQNNGVDVKIQGLPLCYLEDLDKLCDEWVERIFIDMEHQFDSHLFLFSDVVKTYKNSMCKHCKLYTKCEGFWFEYVEADSFEGFKPI